MIYLTFGQQNEITLANLILQIKGHGEISITIAARTMHNDDYGTTSRTHY